jgi:hypothetical protein
VRLVLDAVKDIIPPLKEQSMADDTVQAELERLRAENEALKGRAAKGINLKVSEKGAVSVYGLGRFPLTLYKEQWEKVLAMEQDIRAFIAEHAAELKTKE